MEKNIILPLELFNFSDFDCHYFEEIDSFFWDSENTITKNYKILKGKFPNQEEKNDEQLDKAYEILLNIKLKEKYCEFLMYQYILSQPTTISQLVDEYYSIIFPFYLFVLKPDSSSDENNYIILDNINFAIKYFEKSSLKSSFEVNTIISLKMLEDSVTIKIINKKTDLVFSPIIREQTELLYTLIIFMGIIMKKKENWKKDLSKVNEINQNIEEKEIKTIFDQSTDKLNSKINLSNLIILSNDSFVPKSIKLSTYICLDKMKGSPDRFLILGNAYIILFKNEEMKKILSIIPISPGNTMFEFIENEKHIKIKFGMKEFSIFLDNLKIFSKFKRIIGIISEKGEDLLDSEDIVKVSKTLFNDKVMGGDFKSTPLYCKTQKEINFLDFKILRLQKAIKNAENENLIYQKIKDFNNK